MRKQMIAAIKPLVDRLYRGTTWKKGPDGPRNIGVKFDAVMLSEHVMGIAQYGLAQITPGTSTTMVAVLDFDSHKGETSWPEMVRVVREVRDTLRSMGYGPVVWRSSGGMGMHLFCTWDTMQDAYSVREAMRDALLLCDLKSGTGGVAKGMVEIFPKADSVPADGFGNMFILPFANQSRLLDEDFNILDVKTIEPPWLAATPVPHRTKPPRAPRETFDTPNEQLRSALAAIPNEGSNEKDYDQWRNIIFAIHHETDGSDEGLALAHEFSARSSKYDPDFLDNRVWPYIRSDRDAIITGRTILHDATDAGWEDPSLMADYSEDDGQGVVPAQSTGHVVVGSSFAEHLAGDDPLSRPGATGGVGSVNGGMGNEHTAVGALAAHPVAPTSKDFTFTNYKQRKIGERVEMIVEGVLPYAGLAIIYGAPGSGKSFWAIDIASAIARGVDWCNRKTVQGAVAYIVAEGTQDFRNRVVGYTKHHDVDEMPFYTFEGAPNFRDATDIRGVIAGLKAMPVKPLMVFVDTFARVTPGADENSGQDMSKVLSHCQSIYEHTGAMVVLVHHSGKDASKGTRGHSSLNGAADCVIEITRAGQTNERCASIVKQKGGEDGGVFPFTLDKIDVYTRTDGTTLDTCYVVHGGASRTHATGPAQPKGPLLRALLTLVHEMMPMGQDGVSVKEVLDEMVRRMPEDPDKKGGDRRRDVARTALRTLGNENWVGLLDGVVTLSPDQEGMKKITKTSKAGTDDDYL